MGDRVGLIIMLLVIVIMVGGLFFFRAGKRGADGTPANDTLNRHPENVPTDIGEGSHRTTGIPLDRLGPDGTGTAIAGAGAGGETTDARDPLTGAETDDEVWPDQR